MKTLVTLVVHLMTGFHPYAYVRAVEELRALTDNDNRTMQGAGQQWHGANNSSMVYQTPDPAFEAMETGIR